MNKRSYLYSAAVIGLVAAAGVAIPQAQAQRGIALEPSTSWAINKIEGTSSSNDYCAMARRYRPNTVLTFARNQHNEASFALDFQVPKFRQGDGMEVMLDPGAGQMRAFEVYPVSNQAFVIRLGDDEAFFSALNKTGYLRVEFGDKTYNFDLSDIDTGQEKLYSCLGNEGPGNASPVVSDNSFRRDIEDLKRQIERLEGDNQRLAAAPVERVEAETQYDIAESDPADAPGGAVIDQLSTQIAQLEEENQELESKLKALSNGGVVDGLRSPKDVAAIDRLTKENQDLRVALETEQAGDIQAEVLNDRIAQLQDENNALRSGGKLVQSNTTDVSNEDVLALIEENEKLKAQLDEKTAALDDGSALRSTIQKLERENKDLKDGAVQIDESALKESRAQIDTLKKENERLQKVVQASEVSGDPAVIVSELKGQVNKLAEDMKSKESKLVEMSKLTTEVEMLKVTNEQLEKQLIETALQGPVSRSEAMSHRVAQLETQNDALLQKLQSGTEEAATAVGEMDAAAIEALKKENEELKKTIEEGKAAIESNKKLQEEVAALKKENEELKNKATAAPVNVDAAELQKLKDDNQTLQTQLQQKETELSNLKQEVERLRLENDQLKSGAGVPVAETTASPIPGGAPNTEIDNLTRENENLRSQIANMDTSAKDTEITALKKQLEEQQAKIAAADEATKKAEAAAAKAKKEAKDVKAAQKKAEEETKKVAETPAAAPVPLAEVKGPDTTGRSPVPTPPADGNMSSTALDNELVRLENKLSEAKASGDQMAMQNTAREYIRLKSQMSASQELAHAESMSEAEALLNFNGAAAPTNAIEPESLPTPAEVNQAEVNDASPIEQPMNEAQRQEQAMNKPIAIETKKDKNDNLSMRASEDPYASFDTPVHDSGKIEAAPLPEDNGLKAGHTTPEAAPAVEAPANAEWKEATKADVTSAKSGGIYKPEVGVPQLLERAQVVPPSGVAVVGNSSGADKVAYQWKSDQVYGSAVQTPLSDPSRFDSEVQNYLEQTKKRCGEDFAVVPDETSEANGTKVATYEIACVGKGVNSSASLIFFAKQGTFTVLAHEAPADQLDAAMEIRDRLLSNIGG